MSQPRTIMQIPKDWRPIIEACIDQGWSLESGGKHPRIVKGATVIPIAGSPSDRRATRNMIGQLRRAGIEWPYRKQHTYVPPEEPDWEQLEAQMNEPDPAPAPIPEVLREDHPRVEQPEPKRKRGRGPLVWPRIADWLAARPGKVVSLDDIMAAGISDNLHTVRRAMQTVTDRCPNVVQLDLRHWQWAATTAGPPTLESRTAERSPSGDRLFEEVRVLRDGSVLLEDEHGDLWRARRLVEGEQ